MKPRSYFALGFSICLSLVLLMGQQSAVFPHPVKPTDGVNSITVKAASTLAAAADTAQVVAISPNSGNACANPSAGLTSVYNGATSGTSAVQVVALSGTTKVYVCSLSVVLTSGTSPTFALVYGTGTACGTGQGNVTFPVSTTATPITYNGPIVGVTPAGNALCYLQTGTTPINKFVLTYVQQ
jgi:hypothetical protein